MPISKSAKKALRVSKRNNLINRRRKLIIKAALKGVSNETVNRAFSLIDKAVKWRIFHTNKAARLKAQLSKKFSAPKIKTESEVSKAKNGKAAADKKLPSSKGVTAKNKS